MAAAVTGAMVVATGAAVWTFLDDYPRISLPIPAGLRCGTGAYPTVYDAAHTLRSDNKTFEALSHKKLRAAGSNNICKETYGTGVQNETCVHAGHVLASANVTNVLVAICAVADAAASGDAASTAVNLVVSRIRKRSSWRAKGSILWFARNVVAQSPWYDISACSHKAINIGKT